MYCTQETGKDIRRRPSFGSFFSIMSRWLSRRCLANTESWSFSQSASGTGLAFITFTDAIDEFSFPLLWAVLFFAMLFTLGIDSQFGTLEGALTSIEDLNVFPSLRKEFLTGEHFRVRLGLANFPINQLMAQSIFAFRNRLCSLFSPVPNICQLRRKLSVCAVRHLCRQFRIINSRFLRVRCNRIVWLGKVIILRRLIFELSLISLSTQV